MKRRFIQTLVAIAACLTAAAPGPVYAAEAATPFQPNGSVKLQSGNHLITGRYTLVGDIYLAGTAVLTIESPNFVLDGNIVLREDALLRIQNSVFTIANHFVLDHSIEARERAVFEIKDSTFITNPGTVEASLPSQYRGYNQTIFRIDNVAFSTKRSWLLADFFDSAELRTKNSKDFPTETYPHDSSTINVEGALSDNGVWLPFAPGSKATLGSIPLPEQPFNFSFGRNTPGLVNITYQVNVINGVARFAIISTPQSDLTVNDNGSQIAIGYAFSDLDTPQTLTGITPGSTDTTLTHQGRVLKLISADLQGFAWQIYCDNPGLSSPEVLTITECTINELGASKNGKVFAENNIFQWAVIAAAGQNSSIEISRSTINSQSILAEKNGIIKISASEIFGSLVQARDEATILLLNNSLKKNLCHSLCVPICPPHANGGCNPFNNPGEEVRFLTEENGSIVVLGINPISGALPQGQTYDFIGDLFVESAQGSMASYTYNLLYKRKDAAEFISLTTGGTGPKRGVKLGTLDTSGLAAGDFVVVLDIIISGVTAARVERPFTVTAP